MKKIIVVAIISIIVYGNFAFGLTNIINQNNNLTKSQEILNKLNLDK